MPESTKTCTVTITGPTATSGKPGDIISGFNALVTEDGQPVPDAKVIWKASNGVTVDESNGVSVTIPSGLEEAGSISCMGNIIKDI